MTASRSPVPDSEPSGEVTEAQQKEVWEASRANLEAFDQRVGTIAAGSLALTVTFVEDLIGEGEPSAGWLALASWVSLTIALAVSIFSHLVADFGSRAFDQGKGDKTIEKWNRRVMKMNISAGLSLVMGLFGLAVLAFLNL